MPRYTIHRKDRNHDELVNIARRGGAYFRVGPPLDGLCWVNRWSLWMPVEIKPPDREGTKREYTEAQQKFLADCERTGAKYWVWRTEADVIRDLGGRL